MIKVHCQGCGRSERIDQLRNGDRPTIRTCNFETEGFDGGKWTADLCQRCVDRLKANFFGIEPGPVDELRMEREALSGPPEMPRFLEDPLPEPIAAQG